MPFLGRVANFKPSEYKREEEPHKATGITEERLDGVGFGLLLFVDHVAHHHLERLHGDVDARVEKHQRDEAKHHGGAHCHTETTGVGQKHHDSNGNECSDE